MTAITVPAVDYATQATRKARRQRLVTTVVVIVMFAISAFFLLPFAWMLTASVRTEGSLLADPATLWPTVFTLDNYSEIWRRIPFGRQLGNTVVFAGVVTVVSVTLNSMAGYALARFDFRGKNVAFLVLILTLMVPIEVTFVPLYNIISNFGWIDTYQGLIVPRMASAFGIFLMRQFFIALPKDLEDAARIDGASEIRIFLRIMWPLAKPAVLTLGMFSLLRNWNDLLWPLMVITRQDMLTLPPGLAMFKGDNLTEFGLLMAGSVVALIPMVVAFLFVQRSFIEGVATTGMK
ncbi:carbohydrate ABC transporter membrane protein 2 (CUT1 family) [Propionicimonas paludicola]|uniref:Carbohydrate ABC transporter membrane protein 2 (CUT1 family) n=1 Tax=Propionicimonas paludicola TaxID=185243 RepID=A0A2A9CVC1_9ACTN|nr:carbohydrate ABC transporter permease [Propionicimonas paludicola]PFG17995.1 carbohydrate ABC transporter membrane protein 2 (CUT1 family) [Propionicimonas paludicola]